MSLAARRLWLRQVLAAPLLAALSAGAPAREPADDVARAVRLVVEAQLRAMADGDDERAFSYAAPGIRAQFGTAARFMAMVQGSYPMVVRPRTTAFFHPQTDDDEVLQRVQLRDAQGRHWQATYRLALQPDGAWRITGCAVVPASAAATT